MNTQNINHKDVWKRAVKTGVVVFFVTLLGSLANLSTLPHVSDLSKLVFAAACAAGTAVLNYTIQLTQ